MSSGIYAIHCLESDKYYIGSSKNMRKRWEIHLRRLSKGSHHSDKLQNAWNKYGPNAFDFFIVEDCAASQLISREQYWLDAYAASVEGYNVCSVAQSTLGVPAWNKGKPASPAARQKMREAWSKRSWTQEQSQRLSENMKRVNAQLSLSEGHREKLRKNAAAARLAKPPRHSAATRTKISASLRKYHQENPE